VSNDKQLQARPQGAQPGNPPSTPAPAANPAPAAPTRYVPLLLGRIKTLDQANNTWSVVTPAGTPFEAVLDEKFWSNGAAQFRMFDRIIVNTDDGAYTGTLHVRAAARNWAKVAVLEHHQLGAAEVVKESDTHTVAYRGAYAMWSVIRRADSEVIREKFPTAEEARIWMNGHLRALAA